MITKMERETVHTQGGKTQTQDTHQDTSLTIRPGNGQDLEHGQIRAGMMKGQGTQTMM